MGNAVLVSVLAGVLAVGPASMSLAQSGRSSPDTAMIDWHHAVEDAAESVVVQDQEMNQLQTEEEITQRRKSGQVMFVAGLGVAAMGVIIAGYALSGSASSSTLEQDTGEGAAIMAGIIIGGGIIMTLKGWKWWKSPEASA